MRFNLRITKQIALLAALAGSSVIGSPNKLLAQNDDKTLLGAGSTFIYPLFSKMFSEYNQKTGIQVNYQSIIANTQPCRIVSTSLDSEQQIVFAREVYRGYYIRNICTPGNH